MNAKIKIVDSHHKVLSHWARYRSTLSQAPRLLTLDHHTDTSSPFRHHLSDFNGEEKERRQRHLLQSIQFQDAASVLHAESFLSHDEHIVTAIETDILSSAGVIAHNARDTDLSVYRKHRIICAAVAAEEVTRHDCDRVLESPFLQARLDRINQIYAEAGEPALEQTPYILDLDLDYLNTLRSAEPRDDEVLQRLSKGAGLITIATEAPHVAQLALDMHLTAEVLLPLILKIIS